MISFSNKISSRFLTRVETRSMIRRSIVSSRDARLLFRTRRCRAYCRENDHISVRSGKRGKKRSGAASAARRREIAERNVEVVFNRAEISGDRRKTLPFFSALVRLSSRIYPLVSRHFFRFLSRLRMQNTTNPGKKESPPARNRRVLSPFVCLLLHFSLSLREIKNR